MLQTRTDIALIVAVVLAGAGCGRSANPASPTAGASPVITNQTAGATSVALTGVVRGLDVEARSFTLATRTGVRAIRADDLTAVWSGGRQIRLSAVRDGMVAAVRALDCGSYALARTISITD
jgi:hypothetical protein